MLILDDLLFKLPLKGVLWIAGQVREIAEKQATDEQPVMQAILENELALEEGRVEGAAYEERSAALMARLREIRELKRRMAEERAGAAGAGPDAGGPAVGAPISGKVKLDVDVDLDGYGKGYGKR